MVLILYILFIIVARNDFMIEKNNIDCHMIRIDYIDYNIFVIFYFVIQII